MLLLSGNCLPPRKAERWGIPLPPPGAPMRSGALLRNLQAASSSSSARWLPCPGSGVRHWAGLQVAGGTWSPVRNLTCLLITERPKQPAVLTQMMVYYSLVKNRPAASQTRVWQPMVHGAWASSDSAPLSLPEVVILSPLVVSWGCHTTHHKLGTLKRQKLIFSRF